jgi:hypothetical protein
MDKGNGPAFYVRCFFCRVRLSSALKCSAIFCDPRTPDVVAACFTTPCYNSTLSCCFLVNRREQQMAGAKYLVRNLRKFRNKKFLSIDHNLNNQNVK